MLLSQSNNVDLLLGIFSALNKLPVIEKIIKFAAIDFVEGKVQLKVFILVKKIHNVKTGKKIKPWD